jgi:formylglycine-generating enzyme required for sulfatase activity
MTRCKNRLWVLGVALVAVILSAAPACFAANRDLIIMPKVAADSLPIAGDYWALIIGIDKYQHAPKLESAVKDAKGVRDVLRERYGFQKDRIIELFNEQATGPKIQNALYRLGRQAGKDDSVFIYYAGHGQYDEDGKLGWWVPVEAQPKDPGTFIMDSSVLSFVKGMKAKHVYLVADSCFSGTLFGTRALPPLNDRFFARMYAKSSRWGLTSGGTEPVADQGKNGHSIFAYHLINLLKENTDPYLVPSHIYDQLAPLITNNADQTPRSEPLKGAGDEGGQFVFRLTRGLALAEPVPVPVRPSGPSAELTQRQQELSALEEQHRLLDEQAKQRDLDRQIAEKQQQFAEKKKKLEVASLPSYSTPKDVGREITAKDGSHMPLVAGGEFQYGFYNQRLSLSSFYMDQYEVSTAQYAMFMAKVGAEKPAHWPTSDLASHGQKPVVGVTWHEAEAYCRQYGKRLPTEQEWEKAARGTDGRLYPWGNEEPTSLHANFGKCCVFKSYDFLVNIGSLEAGKSPYGLYDMAGNVWEWTSSDYDDSGKEKVLRGGSWGSNPQRLRSANRNNIEPMFRVADIGFRCAQDRPN